MLHVHLDASLHVACLDLMRENAAPLLLLLFPSPRACARCSVCEVVGCWVVAGWWLSGGLGDALTSEAPPHVES